MSEWDRETGGPRGSMARHGGCIFHVGRYGIGIVVAVDCVAIGQCAAYASAG
jgi:hypothetical protein